MSQNGPFSGPPWSSGGKPDKPYGEPADPWAEQAGPGFPDPPEWSASIPHQHPVPPPTPLTPPPPPPRRNTPIIALVVTLSVLMVVGLGAAWLLKERNDRARQQAAQPSPSATTEVGAPVPRGSEDARFYAKDGDCVVNEGTNAAPDMRITACTSGAYEVLKRFKGRTTGEKDAESKCAKVKGYTKWYFYDSALDDFDFVLCMKEHKPV